MATAHSLTLFAWQVAVHSMLFMQHARRGKAAVFCVDRRGCCRVDQGAASPACTGLLCLCLRLDCVDCGRLLQWCCDLIQDHLRYRAARVCTAQWDEVVDTACAACCRSVGYGMFGMYGVSGLPLGALSD